MVGVVLVGGTGVVDSGMLVVEGAVELSDVEVGASLVSSGALVSAADDVSCLLKSSTLSTLYPRSINTSPNAYGMVAVLKRRAK